jgi:serine protease Do
VERLSPTVVHIRLVQDAAEKSKAGIKPTQGSGFIATNDGYILTADYIASEPGQYEVFLSDKRRFIARLIGDDPVSGLGVLKIEAPGLLPVTFGQTNRIRAGERVFAIGAPYGMPNTVTDGIVSAVAREMDDIGTFIQTNVAINPGNGGGPLFNFRGELIGMNTQIYTPQGRGFSGISFALPVDTIKTVFEKIRVTGKPRGRIGLTLSEGESFLASSMMALPDARGAVVMTVAQGGPSEKAGVRKGDVIRKVDSVDVENARHLRKLVREVNPGQVLALEIWRAGKTIQTTVAAE